MSGLFKNKTRKEIRSELYFSIVNFRPLSCIVNLLLVLTLLQKYVAACVSCLNEKYLESFCFHLSQLHHSIRNQFLILYTINNTSYPFPCFSKINVIALNFDEVSKLRYYEPKLVTSARTPVRQYISFRQITSSRNLFHRNVLILQISLF